MHVNWLRPSDAIWWHRSGSTLAQVMACCLTAPSHYLNQYWLIISKVLWHSSEGNFIKDTSPITKVSLKIAFLILNWNLPGANELIHCGLVPSYGIIHWVDSGSGNALLPDEIKPLPEPNVNFLAPLRCCCNLKFILFKFIPRIDILSISCEITLRGMPKELTDG